MEHDPLISLLAPSQERMGGSLVANSGNSDHGQPEPKSALPGAISEAELAALLGINSSRIRQLTRDGILHRIAPATYDLREAVKSYCANLRDKAARLPAADDPIKAEKLRIATAQANALELKNEAARGELVPSLEVERAWSGILRDLRSTLLAVPSRCGATLPHLTAHDIAIVDREIKAALEGLANGD